MVAEHQISKNKLNRNHSKLVQRKTQNRIEKNFKGLSNWRDILCGLKNIIKQREIFSKLICRLNTIKIPGLVLWKFTALPRSYMGMQMFKHGQGNLEERENWKTQTSKYEGLLYTGIETVLQMQDWFKSPIRWNKGSRERPTRDQVGLGQQVAMPLVPNANPDLTPYRKIKSRWICG